MRANRETCEVGSLAKHISTLNDGGHQSSSLTIFNGKCLKCPTGDDHKHYGAFNYLYRPDFPRRTGDVWSEYE